MYCIVLFFTIFLTHETFASFKWEVDESLTPYGKGCFLPVRATSFKLDRSALTYPTSIDKNALLKVLMQNDKSLMFYLSKNKGLSNKEKFHHRLQAFQCIINAYNKTYTMKESAIFFPLFRFTGGNWMRLQGFLVENGSSLNGMICSNKTITTKKLRRENVKYVRILGLTYYRFLSRQEHQIREGANPMVPRDQRAKKDRTPQPRSLRKGKQKNGW